MNPNEFVKKDDISCSICYYILDNPVECEICNHNFCLKCYNERIEYLKKNNLEIKCAYCNENVNGEWKIKRNPILISFLKHLIFECKNCKKKFFNEYERQNHENQCKLHKCKICKKEEYNEKFLNHLKEHKEELDKLINSLNKNYYYLETNGLYYCDKKTNLNCGCCDGICHLGSCLCIKCMNRNKEFKHLNKKYLINKSGKASKFKINSYYCNQEFFTTLSKNRSFLDKSKCYPPNQPCPDCQILTKLMKKYLDSNIYNSIINN